MRLGFWILLGIANWAAALPSGPHVVAGKAKIEMPDSVVLSIDVSNQAIIEWDSFSIEKGEIARFVQPNANSAVLNRVMSDSLSQIAGKLTANGHIYLINPNGIVMKDSAVIEAYSFIAQTYDLPDADFLAHDFREGPLFLPPTLHSSDSDNPYAAAICHSGKIETLKIEDQGGHVYLLADRGTIEVEGEIVSRGGDVRLLGEYIRLQGDAAIDVSSQVHAGSVRIGGDLQGKNPLFPNARQVVGGSCAKVLANGIDQAHGGSIVLFAKEAVRYLGVLEAKGGVFQGDGGFIEVSAKHDLDYQGIADLTAPFGKTGSLVLDPISIMVFAGSSDTDVQIDSHPSFVTISPIASSARIRPSTIINNLMLSNVIVESSSEAGLEPGDIFIASPIIYSSKNDLTFRTTALSSGGVGGDIYVNAAIRNTGLGGSIFIESAQDIVQTNASVATSGGDIGYTSARDFFWYNLTPTILQNVQAAKSLNIELGRDFIASQTVNLSANDAFSLAVGGKALLYKGTNLGSIVFECLSGPTNLIVGGDLNVDGFFQLDSDQMLTVEIGGDFFASEGALIRTLGVGLPQISFQTGGDFKVNEHIELGIGGAGPMTYEIGGNFIIDGGSVVFQNDVVVLAQNNIEFLNGAVLDMQGTTVQSVQLEAKEDIFFQGEMAGVTNTDPIAPVSLNVSAGRDFIMEPGTVAYTDGTGSCLLSAGRDLLIQESCDVHTSTGDLTLMADNHPIDSVEVWTGSFVKQETAKVASAGALKIFAADQGKILILGEINAIPYVAGPEFVNSSREIWGAHFSSYEAGPFTIFYKNVYVPFALIQAFNESVYEFLQNIQKFDRFYWDLKEISAGNREYPSNYTIIDPKYWLPDIYCK